MCRLLQRYFDAEGIENETLESAPGRGNSLSSMGDKEAPSVFFMSHTADLVFRRKVQTALAYLALDARLP
ncbi:MAG: hypothetical protein JW852_09630 [Spirochaetales bacterium]|nr:hypothetical protein [Spirochaetales bacterium]